MRAKDIIEGDVVDFGKAKFNKGFERYSGVIKSLHQREAEFFNGGKFLSFAKTFINHEYDPKFAPEIYLSVMFRDYKMSPNAALLKKNLRKSGFSMTGRYKPDWGGMAEKKITLETARKLFSERNDSIYGNYLKSSSGFRTRYDDNHNEDGIGFHISVAGYDDRIGDKYGNSYRYEVHIIDDEDDMAEVVNMFALIKRSQMR